MGWRPLKGRGRGHRGRREEDISHVRVVINDGLFTEVRPHSREMQFTATARHLVLFIVSEY